MEGSAIRITARHVVGKRSFVTILRSGENTLDGYELTSNTLYDMKDNLHRTSRNASNSCSGYLRYRQPRADI